MQHAIQDRDHPVLPPPAASLRSSVTREAFASSGVRRGVIWAYKNAKSFGAVYGQVDGHAPEVEVAVSSP